MNAGQVNKLFTLPGNLIVEVDLKVQVRERGPPALHHTRKVPAREQRYSESYTTGSSAVHSDAVRSKQYDVDGHVEYSLPVAVRLGRLDRNEADTMQLFVGSRAFHPSRDCERWRRRNRPRRPRKRARQRYWEDIPLAAFSDMPEVAACYSSMVVCRACGESSETRFRFMNDR